MTNREEVRCPECRRRRDPDAKVCDDCAAAWAKLKAPPPKLAKVWGELIEEAVSLAKPVNRAGVKLWLTYVRPAELTAGGHLTLAAWEPYRGWIERRYTGALMRTSKVSSVDVLSPADAARRVKSTDMEA